MLKTVRKKLEMITLEIFRFDVDSISGVGIIYFIFLKSTFKF